MEEDAATPWLDTHLARDQRWSEADQILVDEHDLDGTDESTSAAQIDVDETVIDEMDSSWLDSVDVDGLDVDVEQILIDTEAAHDDDAARDDRSFDLPTTDDQSAVDPSPSGIVDPFDEFLAAPERADPMSPDAAARPGVDEDPVEADHDLLDVDIAPDDAASPSASPSLPTSAAHDPNTDLGEPAGTASSHDVFDLLDPVPDPSSGPLDTETGPEIDTGQLLDDGHGLSRLDDEAPDDIDDLGDDGIDGLQ